MQNLYVFTTSLMLMVFLSVPVINLLYKLKFNKNLRGREKFKKTRNLLYYKFYDIKSSTPEGFGLLLFPLLLIPVIWNFNIETIAIILFSIIFGITGLIDDLKGFFTVPKTGVWGIRIRYKLFIQFILATTSVFILFGLSNPLIFVFQILILIFILNSYNITDGLDGLAGGFGIFITITSLLLFQKIHYENLNSILVSLLAYFLVFLYFNVSKARVFMGDTGAMSLGFIFGILFLKLGLVAPFLYLLIIAEGLSSVIQMTSLKFLKKGIFLIAPIHLLLLNKNWTENNIVFRSWIIQILLCVFSYYIFGIL